MYVYVDTRERNGMKTKYSKAKFIMRVGNRKGRIYEQLSCQSWQILRRANNEHVDDLNSRIIVIVFTCTNYDIIIYTIEKITNKE